MKTVERTHTIESTEEQSVEQHYPRLCSDEVWQPPAKLQYHRVAALRTIGNLVTADFASRSCWGDKRCSAWMYRPSDR